MNVNESAAVSNLDIVLMHERSGESALKYICFILSCYIMSMILLLLHHVHQKYGQISCGDILSELAPQSCTKGQDRLEAVDDHHRDTKDEEEVGGGRERVCFPRLSLNSGSKESYQFGPHEVRVVDDMSEGSGESMMGRSHVSQDQVVEISTVEHCPSSTHDRTPCNTEKLDKSVFASIVHVHDMGDHEEMGTILSEGINETAL